MKKNLIYILYTLIFTPLFFSMHGIYKGVITATNLHLGERGLVFPLILLIGINYLILILIALFKGHKLKLKSYMYVISMVILIYTFILSLIGLAIENQSIIILRFFQFATYIIGIIIFYYLFKVKNINFATFFRTLYIMILVFIVFHYLGSIKEIGMVNSLKSIGPNIFFFGIYQSRVYYPYLVLCLFFFAINFVRNDFAKFLGIIIISVYIFSLQVRGAFISLICYLILYFIFKVKNKILAISAVLTMILPIHLISTQLDTSNLGRFSDTSKFGTFNGRVDIWKHDIETNSITEFLFGHLFYDADGISSHNQYLNFYVYGGATLLLLFSLVILYFIFSAIHSIYNKSHNNLFAYAAFFVPIIVDLNLNVPLNNINSTIIYTFIWSSILFYLSNEVEYEENKI